MASLTVGDVPITPAAESAAEKLRREYAEALKQYCVDGAESALGRGYEIGRLALERGMSLLELVMLHEEAARAVLHGVFTERASNTAVQFLAETLVPFEMSHRGFLEANRALREVNEKLEGEARRIAIMLHDGAGQMLFALQLALSDLAREVPAPLLTRVNELLHLSGRLDNQLRCLSRELHPVVLDDLGLVPALELMVARIAKHTGIRITIQDSSRERFPAVVERCLYRVVQEALSNAVKHSGARSIVIALGRTSEDIVCSVRDDGAGIPSEVIVKGNGGLGLVAMRERLEMLRGTLAIKSVPAQGTELLLTIPCGGA